MLQLTPRRVRLTFVVDIKHVFFQFIERIHLVVLLCHHLGDVHGTFYVVSLPIVFQKSDKNLGWCLKVFLWLAGVLKEISDVHR